MHEESRAILKEAILAILPLVRTAATQYHEQHMIWKKLGEGRWQGSNVTKPGVRTALVVMRAQIEERGEAFATSFLNHHPNYAEAVNLPGFYSTSSLSRDKGDLLKETIKHCWHRHGHLDLDLAAVEAVIDDVADFVDQPVIKTRF